MEKKIHIVLFDKEGRITGEKMIGQDSEFYNGPDTQHDGPFRLGITFMEQADVEKAITYIQKLTGILPLSLKEKKLKKSEPDTPQFRQELIAKIENEIEDQDQMIKLLREQGFVFNTWDYLETMEIFENIKMKPGHKDYQWMVKRLKTGKNPKVDKYDPMLMFGIQLMDARTPKVIIYFDEEFLKVIEVPIPEKPRETHKKTEMMKFPAAMIQEERDKFRFELRALQLNPEKEITKFFARWNPYIENVPSIPQIQKPKLLKKVQE